MYRSKKCIFLCFVCCWSINVLAQLVHSHNDYEQERPFYLAYELHFDSIEADLYLKDGELYVAHDFKNIKTANTFHKMYLEPLIQKIKENNGFVYPDKKSLQLLIDLKRDGKAIIGVLFEQLKPYRKYLKHVKIVISGDMPQPDEFQNYDKIFWFDGRKNLTYSKKQWKRVGLMSASMLDFGKFWTGKEALNQETVDKVKQFVKETHQKQKLLRLWATPNTVLGFETLKSLQVDFIGSDNLQLLNAFLIK
jgi:glycerophosphoryl diester phosphodiesterase